MWRLAKLSLMKRAIGLPFTNVVKTLAGRPKYDETLNTLLSALVACMNKFVPQCIGWPSAGVSRTPMLVGVSSA
jgi:hypothetical protein